MNTDITGLRKAVTKQLDLSVAEYTGTAKEGDLVIDCNDGATQYQLFVGTSTGALTQVTGTGGGGSNANYANFAGNVANGTSNVSIPVVNGNVSINVGSKEWEFGSTGNITLPGGGNIFSNADMLRVHSTTGALYLDSYSGGTWLRGFPGTRIYVNYDHDANTSDGYFTFFSNFGTPTLRFDDATFQTTAWTANLDATLSLIPPSPPALGTVLTANGTGGYNWANTITTSADLNVTGVLLNLQESNIFVRTITGGTTLSLTNLPPSGRYYSFILQLTNPSTFVTFWAGIKWDNSTPPTLTAVGTDVLQFYTYDGGATWVGVVLAQNIG